jgi:hypothetical protein
MACLANRALKGFHRRWSRARIQTLVPDAVSLGLVP